MKRILIINTTYRKGGAAHVAQDIFLGLQSEYEPFFAYGRGKKSKDKNTFYFGNKLELLFHVCLVRFFGLEGAGSIFSTIKLINYIKRGNFDIINIHNLHGYYLNFRLLLKYLKNTQTPILYTVHDEWPVTWLPAHSMGCKHCKTGIGSCSNNYSYPKNYFPFFAHHMLRLKKNAFSGLNMTISCPSSWLRSSLSDSFLADYPIFIVNNAVDIDVFKPTKDKANLRFRYNLPSSRKIICFSASNLNDPNKGVKYILEAAKILSSRGYLFIGIGGGELIHTKNIISMGYIEDKLKLADLYSLSDLFVFASSAETFLLSAVEAMSCAIPCVGFRLPVIEEIIDDEVGGLTQGNANDLAAKIDIILSDENQLKIMSLNCRRKVEQNFSKEIFLKKYLSVLRRLLVCKSAEH